MSSNTTVWAAQSKRMDSTGARRPGIRILICMVLGLTGGAAEAVPYNSGALDFSTADQSMWGPGAAPKLEDSIFVGTQWQNAAWGIGGIIGGVSETTIYTNPGWWAWAACDAIFPGWCGGAPDPWAATITVDTRTGARLDLTTSGKFGLEFGYVIDSGSVDAGVEFSALASLPNQNPGPGEFFDLNALSSLDYGIITTQSPQVEAYVNVIAQLSASVQAQACLIFAGCAQGGFGFGFDVTQPIVVASPGGIEIFPDLPAPLPDPLAEVALFNQELELEGTLSAALEPGFKLSVAGVTLLDTSPSGTPQLEMSLASLEVNIPDIATTGGIDALTGLIKSSGRDDVLRAKIDLDGVGTMLGVLPPFGFDISLIDTPALKIGVDFDVADIDAGPDIGITQDFALDATLMARLDFSAPVMIDGSPGWHDFWEGPWDALPDFALSETTTFDPTFWLDANLDNFLGIDLGLSGTMELLQFEGTASVGGVDILSVGPVSFNSLFGLSNQLFATDKLRVPVFDLGFPLGGFNRIAAAPFTIGVNVPEPGVLLLLLPGFALLARRRFRM